MRITFNSQYRDSSAAVERTAQQLLEAQRHVSTGKRLGKISDDPTAASTSVAERNHLAQVDQYTRMADSVGSRLAVVDTVLSDTVEKITSARAVATAARGSSKTQAEREAAAQQLGGLRDALLDNMNTMFHNTYLFGGSQVTTRPYSVTAPATVAAYNGDNNRAQVDVGDGRAVTVAYDGQAITQGSDAQDLFETLEALITSINTADDDAIGTGLAALQRAFDRATTAQARIGNDMQVIDAQKMRLQQLQLSGTERLSKLEDVNMAEAITDMTQADAAYRASLGAVGTVSRVSLLDYLK
jgi:flagellar hook-associated protein 3 FlgL